MLDSSPSILPIAVYVHLGSNMPKHLKLNLIRHQLLFPNQELVLITSHDQQFDLPQSIRQFKVNSEELEKDLFSEMSQKRDFEFRNGFWKYTLQRFFAIGEFHKANSNRRLTHIESDVLLMPNFPWEKFADLNKLTWLKVNSGLDVAAIIHFPTLELTQKVLEEISKLSRLNPETTDMLVLHDVTVNLKHFHEYLPSITSDNAHNPKNFGASEKDQLNYFEGIFDPAILGIWYFGQDPKNSFGLRKRYVGDESHDLNPKKMKLKFEAGILVDQNQIPVFSLHLHSKHLPLFAGNWADALESGILEAQKQQKRYSFEIKAMYWGIRGRRVRNTAWILIAHLPGVKQLRKLRALETLKNLLKNLLGI
jgi:hypothetical protein